MFWSNKKTQRSNGRSQRARAYSGRRLSVESLESRLAPAVLPVTASLSLVSQLGAANAGDTLEIEPGAVIGTLGNNGISQAATLLHATTITSNNYFAPGQVIDISHAGDTAEIDLVDAVSGSVGNYTLTLHTPLADTHQDSSMLQATPDLLGIGKGITIEGDPAHPASALLSGTVLEYFTQNGAPAPDALTHLALTEVEGTTSSNLSITGDTFSITTGSNDAIAVTSHAALTISSDSFTVGGTAALVTVVDGRTGAGAITFASDTINVTGNLTGSALSLASTSGPVSLTSLSFSVSGTIGGDGIYVDTAGDVTIGGTNTIHVTGAVTDSVLQVTTTAGASISNITATLSANVGDGIEFDNSSGGNLTASNISITVDGNITGATGDGAGIDLDAGGSGAIANLTVSVQHGADCGLYAEFGGNLSVSGTERVTVTGAVADYGMYVHTDDGAITVSTSLSVSLGSTAKDGLYLDAADGNVTVGGAITVSATGAVSNDGAYIDGEDTVSLSTVTVTLGSSASDGLYAYGYTLTANGVINVSVTGAVSEGVELESDYGDLNVNAAVTATIGTATVSSSAEAGVYLYAEYSNLIVKGAITAHVTGDVSDEGVYAYGDDDTTIAASVKATIGGTADYGVDIEGFDGFLTDTAGVTVTITGAVTHDAAYFYATTLITVANVTVTADDIADGQGVYVYQANGGNGMTVSNINVTANTGTSSAYGVDLYTEDGGGPITASAITVHMNADAYCGVYADSDYGGGITLSNVAVTIAGTADYGLYDYGEFTSGNLSLTNATVNVTGAVADDGVYAYAEYAGNMTIGSVSTKLGSSAGYGIYAETYGSLTVNGALGTSVTGAVGDDGIYLYASYGAVTVSSPITATLGSSAAYGVYAYADDNDLTVNGAITVNVTGDVSDCGVELYADHNTTVSAAIQATIGGTADYGVYIYADDGSLTVGGALSASVTGAVSDDGVYVYASYGAVTVSSPITATLSSTADYGVYVYADDGNLAISGAISAHVTGDVYEYGVELYGAGNTTVAASTTVTIGNATNVSTADYGVYIYADEGALSDTAGVTVTITGAVSEEAAEFYGVTQVSVSNVTVTADDIASAEGVYIEQEEGGAGMIVSNINVTANTGTSSAYGVYLYSEDGGGPITASGITIHMNDDAEYGLYAYSSSSGGIALSNVAVTIGGAASYGVYEYSPEYAGALTLTNATVNITGAVSDDGVYVYGAEYTGPITLDGVSATLGSMADYGIYASTYGNLTVNGALSASVTGAVASDGISLQAEYGDITVTSPITAHLGAGAGYGIYLLADKASITDTAATTVTVGGNVSDDGVYVYGHSDVTLTGNFTVTLSGTAGIGLYLEAEYGFLHQTGTVAVSITGQVTTNGEGVYAYGYTGASLTNITVTLGDGSLGYGAYLEATYGNLTVSNVSAHITGAVSDYGVYLDADGNVTSTNVSASLSSTAEYGIYGDADYGNLTMTTTTVSVGGIVSDYGAYLYAGSAETISTLSVTLAATAEYGVYAEASKGNLSLSGVTLTATGRLAQDGVYLDGTGGNVAFTGATIALNGGVTNNGLDAESTHGDLAINNNKITVKSNASVGVNATASGSLSLTGNTITLMAGGTGTLLTGASGDPQTIESNTFNTAGLGTGLAFSGGATVVALVQGNSFQNNLVGVAITGDGTNAGDIDLGGGLLGSLGKNNFSGFTGASGHYAITLKSTDNTSTVYALSNTFTVANPATVVADEAEHGGTGIIVT